MRAKLARVWRTPVLAVMLGVLLSAPAARAAEYVLGPEDVLSVSVYLHPELERTATIDANGDVTLPPVGTVKAAGLTPKQLGDRLADKLSTYLRQTTAVTVTVTQFMSHSVFVTGAIAKPGRYGFEVIPSLVEVIGQAGGAVPGADLSHVQIVRKQGANRRTLYADVSSTLRDGDTSRLPALEAGDTVILPGGIGAAGSLSASGGGVGVIGEVGKPGLYGVGEGQDVWTLLAVAGGVTREGNLSNVRVVTREGSGVSVVKLNLKQVLEQGSKSIFVVKDGDVVYVPRSASSKWGVTLTTATVLAGITRDVFNILVLRDIANSNP
jgi:polysaccharide export outer membrane protein